MRRAPTLAALVVASAIALPGAAAAVSTATFFAGASFDLSLSTTGFVVVDGSSLPPRESAAGTGVVTFASSALDLVGPEFGGAAAVEGAASDPLGISEAFQDAGITIDISNGTAEAISLGLAFSLSASAEATTSTDPGFVTDAVAVA